MYRVVVGFVLVIICSVPHETSAKVSFCCHVHGWDSTTGSRESMKYGGTAAVFRGLFDFVFRKTLFS